MGLRGPAPIPTSLRVLRGIPDHQPVRDDEPKPEKKAPRCPEWLDEVGRRKWRQYAKRLERLGLLTELDGDDFAYYCDAFSQLMAARKVLKGKGLSYRLEGNGYIQQRPEVAMYHKLHAVLCKWSDRFGMNPSARSRIAVNAEEPYVDPFQDFLNRGNRGTGAD